MKKELTIFKALSDETRLRILVLLSERELCVCQLEAALGLSQARVSRHLTVLRNAGLVHDRREGLWIFYSLACPENELEKSVHRILKSCFKKDRSFKEDISNMRKCLDIPREELPRAQGNRGGKA
ncbi:MAG: metalloregulator ArsR/SmtB family transcription factor [Nitrospirae bacterium]|nr:metalloregulator ArsR/SmtB family transcription factor [Nitrospirota bacterium]